MVEMAYGLWIELIGLIDDLSMASEEGEKLKMTSVLGLRYWMNEGVTF